MYRILMHLAPLIGIATILAIETPSIFAQAPVEITVFGDEDSFTIFIAEQEQPISLAGFRLLVTTGNAQIQQILEKYPAFVGLPFDELPTPICFRLERDKSNRAIPLECQNANLLIQRLTDSDTFWHDQSLNQDRVVLISNGADTVGLCAPGQSICHILYTALEATSVPPSETSEPPLLVDCTNDFNVPMVEVPGTTFFMGLSDDDLGPSNERPGREVQVNPFCIDAYEVTNARYTNCVNDGICSLPRRTESALFSDYFGSPSFARFPVINVTWEQAQAYCEYRGGRLPTEAEWELVARYDPDTEEMRTYPWGMQSPNASRANYIGRGIGDAVEVGQHPDGMSLYGVFDLSGNVAEWVADWYGPYNSRDTLNPVGPQAGTQRGVRGGSYASDAEGIRGGHREARSPNIESDAIGFRCVIPMESR